MTKILWLVLVVGYGFFTWAAGKFSKAALSFLDGGYLAFLCFAVLPRAMGTEYFFLAAFSAGLGVLTGLWLEEKQKLPALIFAIVTGCQLFWGEPLAFRENLFLAFFGGMGLYHASATIIPDKIEIGKALLSGAGFLAGTFLFSCF
ncbi:hypothetical protein [Anaerotignum sp.]|nr:hypothetical protein [Anaerotignum sp.]MBP3306920.1 hypothetical protein [Anaerotignum sp.]MBP3627845.1 hypothetical protein [Anaerotignum sp.]